MYQVILNTTNNNIGYVRFLLESLFLEFRNKPRPTDGQILEFLTTNGRYLDSIFNSCRMPSSKDIREQHFTDIFMSILQGQRVIVDEELHYPLIKSGLFIRRVIPDSSFKCLDFSCTWLRDVYMKAYSTAHEPVTDLTHWDPASPSIDHFLYEILSRMDMAVIQNRQKTYNLSEYAWQFEFYRCAYDPLGSDNAISGELMVPNSSDEEGVTIKEKKGSGRLDFWINGRLGYGFELFRDNIGIKDHASRFTEGGQYHSLVKDGMVRDWRIINFSTLR